MCPRTHRPRCPHGGRFPARCCSDVRRRDGVCHPKIQLLHQTAACRILLLRLRGEPVPRPATKSLCIVPRDVDHRMIHSFRHVRTRPLRRAPGRARHLTPPRRGRHRIRDQSTKFFFWNMAPENKRPTECCCLSHIACSFNEFCKALVRYRVLIDERGFKADPPDGAFSIGGKRLSIICAHQELAARQGDHALAPRGGCDSPRSVAA